jgi:Na+/H+-dicarboxylate symporter
MRRALRRLIPALWVWTVLGLALGVIVGLVLGERAVALKPIGDIFLRLIRMLVVPSVFVMVVSAIALMGDTRQLSSLGARMFGAYMAVMAVAVASGLALAALLQVGAGVHFGPAATSTLATPTVQDQLLAVVPTNIVEAFASGDLVAILLFAVLFGVGIVAAGESGRSAAALFQSVMAVLLKIIGLVMRAAPVGVFALTATAVGSLGVSVFVPILRLALAVLAGSLFQVLVVHVAVAFLGGLQPIAFLRGVTGPMLIGFTSTSTAASLPASLTAAEVNLGLGKVVPSIVLPLGAVIGKTGAAMFMGLMAMFCAQALHLPMTPRHLVVVGAATLLMAMSVPSVPSGSFFVLVALMNLVGASDVQAALVLGVVLPFDRPLDMLRTIPNVTGGLAVAAWLSPEHTGPVPVQREGDLQRIAPVELSG